MDIELARTFLEIAKAGSFIAAAENLHITQTAVTARIRKLEEQLNCTLFLRSRNGASLTSNGERFVDYARQLLQTWESAKQDLPLTEYGPDRIRLGGEISLWNPLLLNWVNRLRQADTRFSITTHVHRIKELNLKLESGMIDAAIVHQPEYQPGLQIEELVEEKLIMVRSAKTNNPYVYIDWGDFFKEQHDAALPQLNNAEYRFDLGPLGLRFILENGGSGYFRSRAVKEHLQTGELTKEPDYPEFSYPVYLVISRKQLTPALETAVNELRKIARQASDWS